MNAATHKEIIRNNFAELARGNGQALVDSLADEVQWTIIGTTVLSRTFRGKAEVLAFLGRFREALVDGHIEITVERLLADGDFVVAQGHGKAETTQGVRYDNTYCWVYQFAGGRIVAITEYLDTELVTRAFGGLPQ